MLPQRVDFTFRPRQPITDDGISDFVYDKLDSISEETTTVIGPVVLD
jgi:hypothetical protein